MLAGLGAAYQGIDDQQNAGVRIGAGTDVDALVIRCRSDSAAMLPAELGPQVRVELFRERMSFVVTFPGPRSPAWAAPCC